MTDKTNSIVTDYAANHEKLVGCAGHYFAPIRHIIGDGPVSNRKVYCKNCSGWRTVRSVVKGFADHYGVGSEAYTRAVNSLIILEEKEEQLPAKALSIRQPWAWAIVHAGKDIENRTWQAVRHGLDANGRFAVHAAKGMTQAEYKHAASFMRSIGITCPPAADLQRGGVIGSVELVDCVSDHASPWFFGPKGLVLENPSPCDFIPCKGALGFFKWTKDDSAAASPAKWMIAGGLANVERKDDA